MSIFFTFRKPPKEFNIKKLSTENKELYGSVKPTEIAKLLYDKDKLDIKPSMIQPIYEIKSLGKFKVKIFLQKKNFLFKNPSRFFLYDKLSQLAFSVKLCPEMAT